jgi:drug/metabolite transporter (DMT)-like permease
MIRIYSILIFGVIVVSAGSIFVRWTGEVPFTVISLYRVLISFCLLLMYQIAHPGLKISDLRHWRWQYILGGFFLAAHFITWIASLQMTTIANSIFLEGMHPLFGVIVSIIFLKEVPHRRIIPVFIIALLGMVLIVFTDLDQSPSKLLGDFLAVLSALCFALYIMIARKYRDEKNFVRYLTYIFGGASLFCAVYIFISGDSFWGYTTQSWVFMILLAIGPNLIGHSVLNWASRQIEIYKVNLVLLLEPVLATMSGIIFLSELPPLNFYFGAGLIISSLWLLIYLEKRGRRKTDN